MAHRLLRIRTAPGKAALEHRPRARPHKTLVNNFHKVLRRLVLRLDRLQTKWAGLSSRGSAIKEELQ
jgi:hypothetical protein